MRAIGKLIWRFMVIFSFIVNLILVGVLIVLGLLIFEIKNQVADPLITGLHSSFVGLNDATIDWTIPVHANVPVNLANVPINADTLIVPPTMMLNGEVVNTFPGETKVVLTRPVALPPLTASVRGIGLDDRPVTLAINGLVLPEGLELPVSLSMNLAIRDQELPVDLMVRAVIPLSETQLHDPVENLRLLFEPLARGLRNLPDDFNGVVPFAQEALAGNVDLLAENEYSENPWPGYSTTAGLNYEYYGEAWPANNVPVETGIVPLGGIPTLDTLIRPELYQEDDTPALVNERAYESMAVQPIPAQTYNGDAAEFTTVQPLTVEQAAASGVITASSAGNVGPSGDMGIISPDSGSSIPTQQPPPPQDTTTIVGGSDNVGTGGPVNAPTPGGDMGIIPAPQ